MIEDDDHAFLSDEISDTMNGTAQLEILMRSVIVTVGVKTQLFPSGTASEQWVISVNGPVTESQSVDIPKAVFTLPPGDYTASAKRLGVEVTSAFTVTDIQIPLDVPLDLTITVE